MSQSIKPESSSTLKPIEDVLESIGKSINESIGKSPSNITTNTTAYTSNRISTPISSDSITSSLAFKIIMFLIIVLAGIVGYTYLEKEVNQLIANIKNYFETKKYTEKEQEQQKEIEKENTSSDQKTEDVIKDVQSDIEKNKKNKKKEEPVNYTPSSKLNSVIFDDPEIEEYKKDTLQKALNDASQSGGEVIPDASESRIQSGKTGWCFIGSDNLSRSCAEIGVNDMCMSGEIYPTKDVCINPNLRA
jgi:hypothetical protein